MDKEPTLPFTDPAKLELCTAECGSASRPCSSSPKDSRGRRLYEILYLAVLFLCGVLIFSVNRDATLRSKDNNDEKVPLEAHIMSKCPDALDCLQLLVLPTMIEVSKLVDFRLSYIGRSTDHDDGVECKHGESECLGDMIELCARDAYPDPKIHLGFTYCLTRQYDLIPQRQMVEDCAMEHGIDFARINHCLNLHDGGYATDLLQKSFERSAEANVTTSCTIRLDEQVRCVRDGGEWKHCTAGADRDSLVRDIVDLYNQRNGA